MDTAERVSQIIREYDEQGWHRTGTDVDYRSAEWLAGRVRDLGVEVELEPFTFEQVIPNDAYVEIDGRRIEGLPLFDGSFTDARGVTGRLGLAGTEADIGLVAAPPQEHGAGELTAMRRSGRHKAIIAVTRGQQPGLAAINAPSFRHPFGPPVIQVSSEHGELLSTWATDGATVRVVAAAERRSVEALNVTARVPGVEPNLPPVVVMTPRSGWWHCASERGGGLACWLEAVRAVREAGTRRDVLLVASSGHELGHLGLDSYMERRPGLAKDAHVWLHLGANIGAAGGGVRLATSDETVEQAVLALLHDYGARPSAIHPRDTPPAGEARNVHEHGGRYVSLVGSNHFFHGSRPLARCGGSAWRDPLRPGYLATRATACRSAGARTGTQLTL